MQETCETLRAKHRLRFKMEKPYKNIKYDNNKYSDFLMNN